MARTVDDAQPMIMSPPFSYWIRMSLAVALLVAAAAPVPPAAQTPPRDVEIVVRRFAFEPAEITAVVGERLRLLVRSADGVHGVEIDTFRVNKEIPRGGKPVEIEFTASREGRFPILCSEYCGDAHDEMKGMLVVQAAAPAPPVAR